MKYLQQIEFYDGHNVSSKDFHHKLMCLGCLKKAEEIYNDKGRMEAN